MVATLIQPDSVESLAEAITSFDRVRVIGGGSRLSWCSAWDGPTISTLNLKGITDLRPDDFVVTVKAGTLVEDLLNELRPKGLTLPFAQDLPMEISQEYGTVGGLFATGLPHGAESQHGQLKDWVLGVQVISGNGDIAKAGSSVLKSVAGFDVQRFAVGSRGALFAISQVTLRLSPVAAVKMSSVQMKGNGIANWVARLPRSKAVGFAEGKPEIVAVDPLTGTLWASDELTPVEGWWIGPQSARSKSHLVAMEHKAKESFDPQGRFVGGW